MLIWDFIYCLSLKVWSHRLTFVSSTVLLTPASSDASRRRAARAPMASCQSTRACIGKRFKKRVGSHFFKCKEVLSRSTITMFFDSSASGHSVWARSTTCWNYNLIWTEEVFDGKKGDSSNPCPNPIHPMLYIVDLSWRRESTHADNSYFQAAFWGCEKWIPWWCSCSLMHFHIHFAQRLSRYQR